MMHSLASDTIAAVSTPPGKGGVAVIRCSGPRAHEIAAHIFRPMGTRAVKDLPSRYASYGHVISDGEPIDDALLTVFDAPHTYTGEPLFEISCHGGVLVTRAVLEAVLLAGARMAEAGEFTRRAFLSGKLTLSDAEAIGDLLEAETAEEVRLASVASRDTLKNRVGAISRRLLHLISSVYVMIDFPDEDLSELSPEEIRTELWDIHGALDALAATYRTGRAITDGIPTVICGSPNVGKSSLYNALLGEDRAIVTSKAGTTRDLLSTVCTAGRVKLLLTDTAGLRSEDETSDEVELIGIRRAEEKLKEASLILAVFDRHVPLSAREKELCARLQSKAEQVIVLLNKSDLTSEASPLTRDDFPAFPHVLEISAASGDVRALTARIEELCTDRTLKTGADAILFGARQYASVCRARDDVQASYDACCAGLSPDIAFNDLESAVGALSELDGRGVSDALVDHIFHRFCVGK